MPKVDITWPKITIADALRAASAAWLRVFGRLPDWDELVMTVAWAAHETNRFKNAAGYNPGGLTVNDPKKYAGDYYESKTHEYRTTADGQKERYETKRLFRSYASLEAGMVDLLGTLARGYPEAVEGLKKGDVVAFVLGLLEGWGKSLDWFSAPFALYLKAVSAHVPEVERELATIDDGSAPRSPTRLFEPGTFGDSLFERVMSAAEAA
jgi:hypothetical protein